MVDWVNIHAFCFTTSVKYTVGLSQLCNANSDGSNVGRPNGARYVTGISHC